MSKNTNQPAPFGPGLETSRRNFLLGLGAFAMLPLTRIEPEIILYNGNVWTVNDQMPRAQAVAISGSRILAVGSNDEVLGLAAGLSRKVDLSGKSVVPGFNDAHAHPCESGVSHLRMVACDMDSIEQIQAALRERAQKTPANNWVLGFLYDDGKTPRPVSRQDLDASVPDHPVLVRHRGGHTIFVNSAALRLAGVDEKTPDPPGGRFEHDSAGHLTGHIGDKATERFFQLIAFTPTHNDYRNGAKFISKLFTSKGVTSATDAMGTPDLLQGYQDARDADELRMRVYAHVMVTELDKMMAAGVHTGFGDDWVRIGAVKQFADGSISERTAWLSQPYLGMGDYRGLKVGTREELYEHGRKAHAAGWQLGTHANGDLAIDEVLSVYEQIQREAPKPDPRFRIEHCTLLNEPLLLRMKSLNVIPVPFSGYVYFHGDVMHFYGEERTRHMFPMRDFLDHGLRPTDSSDYTASPSDPMMWLRSQTTRTDMKQNVWGPNQKITLAEALRCGTLNGAYASFEEDLKGTIEPGKFADLVVLAEDPFKTDPLSLNKVVVERTMVGGKWVYES
ncbi:MAG TPA: amidohydrolase [Terriglobales bacterium]|nr:amidohydrolase [Terriglobales bacterium]